MVVAIVALAAGALDPMIVEEAGGTFTDWTGARTASGIGGIATNAALGGDVRAGLCG